MKNSDRKDVVISQEAFSAYQKAAAVTLKTPVHVSNPTPHSRRKFTRKPMRHCGGCPFPEGCVMCTLD